MSWLLPSAFSLMPSAFITFSACACATCASVLAGAVFLVTGSTLTAVVATATLAAYTVVAEKLIETTRKRKNKTIFFIRFEKMLVGYKKRFA